MPALIHIHGLASGRAIGTFSVDNPSDNLMDFLRGHGIPIASSCGGDGVCRKCVVNGEELSCQLSVAAFLNLFPDGMVKVSYL